ncbi:MAG: cell division protein ZapE [Pseudomonadales bacterium]|nr:cell division protein ZapE [Pseudomonadales bacterium]
MCEGPRSHFDYIEIAKNFKSLVLLNVPFLSGQSYEQIKARGTEDGSNTGEREVLLAPMDDAVRRFIALVDELYEQKTTLFLTSVIPITDLYTQGSLLLEFERARSRLIEMSSLEYQKDNRLKRIWE